MKYKFTFHLLSLVVLCACGEAEIRSAYQQKASEQKNVDQIPTPTRSLPAKLYGVTTDSGYDTTNLPASLQKLSKKTITRIVFDEFVSPQDYLPGTTAVHNVNYVMGEIADSSTVKLYTVNQYVNRTKNYWNNLNKVVDLWEVGNEVNGEWLGRTSDVVAKIYGAYKAIKAQNAPTALTLYYNATCYSDPGHEMFKWTNNNIPSDMKTGLNYVFVSYYEDDCPGPMPDWNNVFTKLGAMFPNSMLGFGEVGTAIDSKKSSLINYYYGLSKPGVITAPRFVGGYFYWYFYEDMVPYTKPLWTTLNNVLSQLP